MKQAMGFTNARAFAGLSGDGSPEEEAHGRKGVLRRSQAKQRFSRPPVADTDHGPGSRTPKASPFWRGGGRSPRIPTSPGLCRRGDPGLPIPDDFPHFGGVMGNPSRPGRRRGRKLHPHNTREYEGTFMGPVKNSFHEGVVEPGGGGKPASQALKASCGEVLIEILKPSFLGTPRRSLRSPIYPHLAPPSSLSSLLSARTRRQHGTNFPRR